MAGWVNWLGGEYNGGLKWWEMLISSCINKDDINKIEISIKTKIKPANL